MKNNQEQPDRKCCVNCRWWEGRKYNSEICTRFNKHEGDIGVADKTAAVSANDPDAIGIFFTGPKFGCTCFAKAEDLVEPFDPFDL